MEILAFEFQTFFSNSNFIQIMKFVLTALVCVCGCGCMVVCSVRYFTVKRWYSMWVQLFCLPPLFPLNI